MTSTLSVAKAEPAVGHIILLNGASSAGKSTLARALVSKLPVPFWNFSIDLFMTDRVLPLDRFESGEFNWRELRPGFFSGLLECLPVLARNGNNLVVDYIVETKDWMQRIVSLLQGIDVYFVGVHCSLQELERRELARGDRRLGEARADFETTHLLCAYDLEVDSSASAPDDMASAIVAAWAARQRPGAFERMT